MNDTMNGFMKAEEFEAFVGARRATWVRMAMSILGTREEAEDLVQETLASLWEKRESLQVENPEAYAARAVWANSLKRRERTKKTLALEDLPEPAAPEMEEDWEYGDWDPLYLEGALEELPEAQRTVVRMKYYMGLSFREIGEALKISLNTAASRCRYALEALRENLLDGSGPPDDFEP